MRVRPQSIAAFAALVLALVLSAAGLAGAREGASVTVVDRSQDGAVAVSQQGSGDARVSRDSAAGSAAGVSSQVTVRQNQTQGSDGGAAALSGATVTIEDSDTADGKADRVVVSAGAARACTLDGDAAAEITISDGDKEATFKNADGVTIQAGGGRITITGSRDGKLIVPDGFDGTKDGKVIASTGITCEDDGDRNESSNRVSAHDLDRVVEFTCDELLKIRRSADRNQYDFSAERVQECLAREVVDGSKHKGELSDTGGPGLAALVPVAVLLLAGAGVLVGRWVLSGRVE